jgi:hypothetical protein
MVSIVYLQMVPACKMELMEMNEGTVFTSGQIGFGRGISHVNLM